MIIFDTNQRSNFSPPRRNKRRHHSRLDEYVVESFIADWQKQKEEAAKRNETAKKSESKGPSAAGLGMLLFLLTPVTGPLYIYFTLHMLQSSLEILKNLPIK